ncbi:MAG: glycosyltransferase [Candidatus Eiseniibacteriota bacterium]
MSDAGRERVLLYVAYFFPPLGGGGVQRTVKFLKYLRPLGWRSEVVTVRARDYWVSDTTLAADVPADTRIWRTAAPTGLSLLGWFGGRRRPGRVPATDSAATGGRTSPRSTLLFRALRGLTGWFLIPDAYIGWLPFAWRAVRRRLRAGGIDALLTTSSPDTAHLVGLLLGRRRGVPWVADFRDPWVRRLTLRTPTALHRRLHVWLEGRVLAAADRVLVTNAATRDDFVARHPKVPASRFAVIPNGVDPADLPADWETAPAANEPSLAATLGAGPRPAAPGGAPVLELLHAGLLSDRRTLAPVLAALVRVLEDEPARRERLELVQLGPRERINDRLVAEHGLESVVRFAPPVEHATVLRAMRAAGALLLLECGGERGALITPGKLFEYLASRRPILAVVPEGPAADLVRELGAGEVVDPDDRDRLAATLARWIDAGPPRSAVTPERLTPFLRPGLARELAGVLDALVASSEPPAVS